MHTLGTFIRAIAASSALAIVVAALMISHTPSATTESAAISLEQRADTLAREQATREGAAPVTTRDLDHLPSAGWSGEQPLDAAGNDWEPNVATDPSGPHAYVLTTRYDPANCDGCPNPAIILATSSDRGVTWSDGEPLCICPGTARQFDPQIAVAIDGTVHASWMDGYDIVTARSSDHGATWTEPTSVLGDATWGDKPWLVVAPSGQDVYVSFHGRSNFVASSHDGGATWGNPIKIHDSSRALFTSGGYVSARGLIVFSGTSIRLDASGRLDLDSPLHIVAVRSTDGGRTWKTTALATSQVPIACENPRECDPEGFDAQASLAGTPGMPGARLTTLYTVAAKPRDPLVTVARTSRDGGATWGRPVQLSRRLRTDGSPIRTALPTVAVAPDGEIRAFFVDDRFGVFRRNAWFRRSTDGGSTWSKPVRISDATGGTIYKYPGGFATEYGDYGGIAITDDGATIAVWGEGRGTYGPGGTWINREAPAPTS